MYFISVAEIVKAEKNKSAPCHATCICRLLLKCDGTRSETIFRLSAKRASPFKSAGASVQSNTGSRSVRFSGSNAGYTMFRGSVKSTGYPVRQFPLHFPSHASPCAITFHLDSTTMPGLGYWVLLSAFHSYYLFASM
jgi:hypothetical protein